LSQNNAGCILVSTPPTALWAVVGNLHLRQKQPGTQSAMPMRRDMLRWIRRWRRVQLIGLQSTRHTVNSSQAHHSTSQLVTEYRTK